MNKIQSKDNNMGLYRINKNSLSSCNHKNHILKKGCSSLSSFHKSTR